MHFYLIPNAKTAITWSEKCACTAVGYWCTNSFRHTNIEGDKRLFLQNEGYNFNIVHLLGLIEAGAVETLIVTTRDPISRMLSSYLNKFVLYGERPLQKRNDLEGFSQTFLDELIDHKSKAFKKKSGIIRKQPFLKKNDDYGLSLKDFIRFILRNKANPQKLNPHFRPQIIDKKVLKNLLHAKSSGIATFQLRVEYFNQDLQQINNHLKFNYIPKKINETKPPDHAWEKKDDIQLTLLNSNILIKNQHIPSLVAAKRLLQNKPGLERKFKSFFALDYELIESFLAT